MLRVVRPAGAGLGISVAGGIGSTPYRADDQVHTIDNYIKYSLDFLRPIKIAEAFEAVVWLSDLPQRTWPNFTEVGFESRF